MEERRPHRRKGGDMIQSLSIRNFKVLREVDINLQPLTVIVGPNASGKTSILQALEALEVISASIGGSRDTKPLGDPNLFRRRNSEGPTRIGCQVKLGGKT